MLGRQQFIDACTNACNSGTFVTPKHDVSNLSTLYPQPRSVNLLDNSGMASYLQSGNFKIYCYADHDPRHTPELYVIKPLDPTVVPGSGVPAMSSCPTTQCYVFSVPSGVVQGWHGYAYNTSKLSARETSGGLTLLGEVL